MTSLSVLIADDHEVVREGVRLLIEGEPEWHVCGEAHNGREAVAKVTLLKPAVVVLDMTMPELSGVDAIKEIKRVSPQTKVVAFSANNSEQLISEVFDAGAKSYIRKADAKQYLVDAIRAAAEGKPYFTPEISQIVFARFVSPAEAAKQRKVTKRERAILRLVAEGRSNKEVADALGISLRTAEGHRSALMRKCGAKSVADLVRYAIRNGVIEA